MSHKSFPWVMKASNCLATWSLAWCLFIFFFLFCVSCMQSACEFYVWSFSWLLVELQFSFKWFVFVYLSCYIWQYQFKVSTHFTSWTTRSYYRYEPLSCSHFDYSFHICQYALIINHWQIILPPQHHFHIRMCFLYCIHLQVDTYLQQWSDWISLLFVRPLWWSEST